MKQHKQRKHNRPSRPAPSVAWSDDRIDGAEAAKLLGIKTQSLFARYTRGQAAPTRYKLGGRVFWRRSDVCEFIEHQRMEESAA
jgi:predicted DNA-binding transcriptional regulator AlpA